MPKKVCRERSRIAGNEKAHVSRHKLDEEGSAEDEEKSSLDELDRKYGPRQVESNWEKYRRESPGTTGGESTDEMKTSDFTELLTYSSDCNYFQFKSEKNWDAEAVSNSFNGGKLFTLDVELLAGGLACIPFYERVDIDKSILSRADVEMCDKKAGESFASYKIILDKFLEKIEVNDALADSGKTESETVGENSPENVDKVPSETEDARQSLIPKCDCPEERENDAECNVNNVKSKALNEENLEDWLDSVLDD